MIRILYFARFREALDCDTEELRLETTSTTVANLLALLRARGGVWADTLSKDARVMAAVNQAMARPSTPITDGDEVAFFPPVTGG